VSQEMVRPENGDERPFVAREPGRRVDDFRWHRPAADNEHIEELPCCSIRRVLQPLLQHAGERRRPVPARVVRNRVVCELLEQEGISGCLARQPDPFRLVEAGRRRDQRGENLPRLVLRHRFEQ